jgi:hypothetical protein
MNRRRVIIAGAGISFPDQVARAGTKAGNGIVFTLVRQDKWLNRRNEVINGEKGENS